MTKAEWFEKLDTVELSNPGQAESAAYITSRFPTEDDGNSTTLSSGNDTYGLSHLLRSNSDFPRTEEEREDYERWMTYCGIYHKLLNTETVPVQERVKYLSRRLVS